MFIKLNEKYMSNLDFHLTLRNTLQSETEENFVVCPEQSDNLYHFLLHLILAITISKTIRQAGQLDKVNCTEEAGVNANEASNVPGLWLIRGDDSCIQHAAHSTGRPLWKALALSARHTCLRADPQCLSAKDGSLDKRVSITQGTTDGRWI